MKSPENTKKHVLCSSAFRSASCGRTSGISVYHTAGKCVYHTTGKYVCYLHEQAVLDAGEFVRIRKSPDKSAIKQHYIRTGEIVDGCEIIAPEPKFKVKLYKTQNDPQ